MPIVAIVGCFIICFAIRPFNFKYIVMQRINHYKWLYKIPKGSTAENRNRLIDYIKLPWYLFSDYNKFNNLVTRKLTLVIGLYSAPVLFLLILLLINDHESFLYLWSIPYTKYLIGVIISSLILFTLTSFKPFLFLGQAERYFEYSAPFYSLLFVLYVAIEKWDFRYIIYIVFFHLCIIILTLLNLLKSDFIKRLLNKDHLNDNVINYLKQANESFRILTIPNKLSYDIAAHINNPNVFYYFINMSSEYGFEHMADDIITNRFPRQDFDWFKNKYGINAIVIDKTMLKDNNTINNIDYSLDQLSIVEKSDNYILYNL